jgi:hypothetical protein
MIPYPLLRLVGILENFCGKSIHFLIEPEHFSLSFFSEQLHQDIQVFTHHIPAPQPLRAVPEGGQLLFFVSVNPSGNLNF